MDNREVYDEPRALIEKPILNRLGMIIGTDFREVPLRYLLPHPSQHPTD